MVDYFLMRRWNALGGMFLILFALAMPAQAGLGDLLGGILEDPISELTAPLAPVVTAVPLVEDLIETVDAVSAPVVTIVDELASPIVAVVDEVVDPVVDAVEPSIGTVEPVIETVEPVIETVEPVIEQEIPLPTVEVIPTPSPVPLPVVVRTEAPAPIGAAELSPEQAPSGSPLVNASSPLRSLLQTDSIQQALLTSISDTPLSLQDREGNQPIVRNTDWLTALTGWLESGFRNLLSIPARFLELLLRALTSAGGGLVAPAAILVALAVGGRRRMLPAS
ncbi:MAG: hypothetical protein ACRDVK_10135 [Acidimicrobiia bacterium]